MTVWPAEAEPNDSNSDTTVTVPPPLGLVSSGAELHAPPEHPYVQAVETQAPFVQVCFVELSEQVVPPLAVEELSCMQ